MMFGFSTRNGSRSEFYHIEGALKLSRMSQSEWRRRWGIRGIVVFDAQISTTTSNDGGSYTSHSISNIVLGNYSGISYNGWMLFDPVTIPAGATIVVAYLSFMADSTATDGTGTRVKISMEDVDDASFPTDVADFNGKARTTANVDWDDYDFPDTTNFYDTPSIVDAVQEVADRGGWGAGQAMQALIDNDASDAGKRYQVNDYSDDTAKACKMHVEYSA